MVLDTMKTDFDGKRKFIFKNTYEDNKQVKIKIGAEEAPDEFFFLNIKLTPLLKLGSSCALMLRSSCIDFIQQCHKAKLINDDKKESLEKYIKNENVYCKVGNLIMKLASKQSDKDGDSQTYLQETLSRVRVNHNYDLPFNLKIANPTDCEPKGLDFLRPIWTMIYSDKKLYTSYDEQASDETRGLKLSDSDVTVTCTRYTNNHKNTTKDAQSNIKTIEDAVRDGLTPGKKIKFFPKTQNMLSRKRNTKWSQSRNDP